MTIGINLLREAREKFAAAVAAVKDELKNPDTAEEVHPAAMELGDAFNGHLHDLGEALGVSEATDSPAVPDAGGVETIDKAAQDASVDKGESKPNDVEPAATEQTEETAAETE